MKLLYAIQIYKDEIPQAIRVARLIADLADGLPSNTADACIVYRFDCPVSTKLKETLEEAFEVVHVYRSTRKETGYPAGANGVWCDFMDHCAFMHRARRWAYDCVLTTEVDAVPLAKDWQERLLSRWDGKSLVKGHWINNGDFDCGHINGNALFAVDTFARSSKFLGAPADKGWDTWFAPEMKRLGWEDIKEIRSLFRRKDLNEKEWNELVKDGCVWLHGFKDDSALEMAKKKLLNK